MELLINTEKGSFIKTCDVATNSQMYENTPADNLVKSIQNDDNLTPYVKNKVIMVITYICKNVHVLFELATYFWH